MSDPATAPAAAPAPEQTLLGVDAPAATPAVAPAAAPVAAAPVAAAPAAATPAASPAPAAAPAAQQTPEEKAAAQAAAEAGAPEKYADFKLPETLKPDAPIMGKFTALAKELNLTQDAAQKVVDLAAEMQTGNGAQLQEQVKSAVEAQGAVWASESKADKEFGGDKFAENMALAVAAREKFGTPELTALLNASKLGNNPEVLRYFYRVGKAISQDGFVPGRAGDAANNAKAFYPASNMNP